MSTVKSDKGVDLGKLQDQFKLAERELHSANKSFAQAGERKDIAKKAFEQADASLQAGVRSVRG